jgi:hypothetical protein
MTKYPTIRCFAPAFLEVFEFRGGAAVGSLLKALGLISEMYHLGKRTLPTKPPTAQRASWQRRLYLFPGQKIQPILHPLVGGFADVRHITAHWVDILRFATSIRSGTATASAMLQKLSAYPRQNGLAVALRELDRIERTLFTLD